MKTTCDLCRRSIDISTIAFVARIIAWVCSACFVATYDVSDVFRDRTRRDISERN